jgi:hypothetical protein
MIFKTNAVWSQVRDEDSYSASQRCAGTNVKFYFVSYTAAQGSGSSVEDVSAQDKTALDYGLQTSLEDMTTCHIASSEDCTCQMRSHLGLPCRHTQRVWLQENLTQVPDAAVDARWLRRNVGTDDSQALHQLSTDACARARAVPTSTRLQTLNERFANLTGLAKIFVEVFSLTPALHAKGDSLMRSLLEKAKSGSLDTRRARQAHQSEAGAPSDDDLHAPASHAPASRPVTLNPLAKGAGDGEGGAKRKKPRAEREKAKGVKAGKEAKAAARAAEKAKEGPHPKRARNT